MRIRGRTEMMIKERIGANSGKTKIENLIFNLHILPMHFAEREQTDRKKTPCTQNRDHTISVQIARHHKSLMLPSLIRTFYTHSVGFSLISVGFFCALFICFAYGTQWRINFHFFFSFIQPFNPVWLSSPNDAHIIMRIHKRTHTHLRIIYSFKIIAYLVNRRGSSLLFEFNVDGKKCRHQTITTTTAMKKNNLIKLISNAKSRDEIKKWRQIVESILKKMFLCLVAIWRSG